MEQEQLIISLKPEELQKLQQLADAAGIASVHDFVKQKVDALLKASEVAPANAGQVISVDPTDEPPAPVTIGGEKWQQLIFELNRLHQELRVFVKESSVRTESDTSEQELADVSENLTEPDSTEATSSEPLLDAGEVTKKIAESVDPLDNLLEKALLKVQEMKSSDETPLPNSDSEEEFADEFDLIEDQNEASDSPKTLIIDEIPKDKQDKPSGQSGQTFKEKLADRSGVFPPKSVDHKKMYIDGPLASFYDHRNLNDKAAKV